MQEKYSIICKPEMSAMNNRTRLISGWDQAVDIQGNWYWKRAKLHTPRATPSMYCFLFCVSLIVTVNHYFWQKPLCFIGNLGRGKNWKRGGRWEGERVEERLLPLPIACPPALSIFRLLLFLSQATQAHYLWVRASEVIWSEYSRIISALHTNPRKIWFQSRNGT